MVHVSCLCRRLVFHGHVSMSCRERTYQTRDATVRGHGPDNGSLSHYVCTKRSASFSSTVYLFFVPCRSTLQVHVFHDDVLNVVLVENLYHA